MWVGILTEVYIDKESKPGSELMMHMEKVGHAHPSPDTAWAEAQEFLEEYQRQNPEEKRKGRLTHIYIRPASYIEDGPKETKKTLN